MDLVQILQIVFIFGSFLFMLLFVLLPIKLVPVDPAKLTARRTQRIVDFASAFAGGVFLGTCFIQLIPHNEAKFVEAFLFGNLPTNYCSTLTQFVIVLGFFLILLLEQIIKTCQRGDRVRGTGNALDDAQEMTRVKSYIVTVSSSQSDTDSDTELVQERKKILKRPASDPQSSSKTKTKPSTCPRANGDLPDGSSAKSGGIIRSGSGSSSAQSERLVWSRGVKRHGCGDAPEFHGDDFGLRCVVLLVALSVHSLFEGVAVGLQDELWSLVNLAIGISLHGCLMAFSLGISLARQTMTRATIYKVAATFSVMIPVGIAIGMVVELFHTGHGFVSSLVSAVLQALTAGTFIYVIFFDILPVQLERNQDRLLKVIVTFVGFIIICALRFVVTEHH